MKLDRNITHPKRGKYALIKLREGQPRPVPKPAKSPNPFPGESLVPTNAIDFGDTLDSEFFVIRLKDKYAADALTAYSEAAREDDPEYADDVLRLAVLAENHSSKKRPD